MKDQKNRKYATYLIITLLLLLATSGFFASSAYAQTIAPTIVTDKEDYSPEETVTITGTGFIPDAKVTLTLLFPNGQTETWTETANDTGAFVTTYPLDGIEGTYTLTATDGVNTATTTFTDCPWKTIRVTATSGGKVKCEYPASNPTKTIIVNEGTTTEFLVWAGTYIKFTAIPNAGCAFKKWDGRHFDSSMNPQTVVAGSGITVTAYFKLATVIEGLKCEPNQVIKYGTETTKISGYLKSDTTGISNAPIILSINIGETWQKIAEITTTTDGYFEYAWDVPESLANGFYVIKAEFPGDDNYCGSFAVTSNSGNLHVIPEYVIGGLLALASCFAAYVVFKKIKHQ
ncbi:MAG: hypothetical protein QXZ70_04725 [Candidatus Bathyarchaeia archaeon]